MTQTAVTTEEAPVAVASRRLLEDAITEKVEGYREMLASLRGMLTAAGEEERVVNNILYHGTGHNAVSQLEEGKPLPLPGCLDSTDFEMYTNAGLARKAEQAGELIASCTQKMRAKIIEAMPSRDVTDALLATIGEPPRQRVTNVTTYVRFCWHVEDPAQQGNGEALHRAKIKEWAAMQAPEGWRSATDAGSVELSGFSVRQVIM